MTTRYCSKCGRAYDLDEHPAYCSGCGESLEGLEKKGKADSGRKGPANPFYLDPEETDPAYWQVKEEIASESDTEIPEVEETEKELVDSSSSRQEKETSAAGRRVTPDRCRMKPWQAGVLSLLIVGAGPIANGQVIKGVALNLFATLLTYVIPTWQFDDWQEILFRMAVLLVSALDGYLCARKLGKGTAIGEFTMFGGRW